MSAKVMEARERLISALEDAGATETARIMRCTTDRDDWWVKVAVRAIEAADQARGGEAVSEAEQVCAQAYQVVGSLLDDLGQFDSEMGNKILDNLAEARLVHEDVLPWPSFVLASESQKESGR